MTARLAPPIPATCGRLDTTPDGLVIPYVQIRLADGGVDFRGRHNRKLAACWGARLCQVCGQRLRHPIVLLGTDQQLERLVFDEAPLHPECAGYTAQACPMVGGRQASYAAGPSVSQRSRGKKCPIPGCDCGGWTTSDHRPNEGKAARPWFAVYVRDFAVALDPEGDLIGGACTPDEVLRVRQVSAPGAGELHPWRPVTDWADRYRPPATVPTNEETR